MIKLRSRRVRILGIATVLLVLVAGGGLLIQKKTGKAGPAMASADSTITAPGDSAEKKTGKDEKKEIPPVPVELARAEGRNIPSYFHATGSLEAKRQVPLIAKAGGQVVRLNVEEGQMVKAGQVLLELEHREEQLLVEQSRVKAEKAKRDLERMQGLVEKGLGSDQDFEVKKELAEVTELDHNLAKVHLDNKIVTAPFSGQITLRRVELGQTVNVGEPLLDIADVSPLEVRLYLPEKIVQKLDPGQRVEIRSDVDADHVFEGSVDRISPAVDPATSTVKVTLSVADAGAAARVGSFVRARITTDVVENAVSIPKRALVPEAGVTYLFVAEGDSVQKVPVTTGYADDEYIEITDGLDLGDHVVCVGQGGLRNGSKIKDLNADASPGKSQETPPENGGDRDYADAQDR